jgi:hypothetical protein
VTSNKLEPIFPQTDVEAETWLHKTAGDTLGGDIFVSLYRAVRTPTVSGGRGLSILDALIHVLETVVAAYRKGEVQPLSEPDDKHGEAGMSPWWCWLWRTLWTPKDQWNLNTVHMVLEAQQGEKLTMTMVYEWRPEGAGGW